MIATKIRVVALPAAPICWKGAARILDDVPVQLEDARAPYVGDRERPGKEWYRDCQRHQPDYYHSLYVPF